MQTKNASGAKSPIRSSPTAKPRHDRDALIAAQLMLDMVQARRMYFDEFLESDGPYWISLGLFIDEEQGQVSMLDRVVLFADESWETSTYLLQKLIRRGTVQQYLVGGEPAYRLTPSFAEKFERYLREQAVRVRSACQRFR